MKREKSTMKTTKYGFLIGALAALALLFGACGNIFDQGDQALENGPAKVRINLVGAEAPPELARFAASATLPSWSEGVTYKYFFGLAGEDPDDGTTAGTDGTFTLAAGNYTVTVKGFVSTTQVLEGSADFTVPAQTDVTVQLEPFGGNTNTTGKLNIAITFPPTASAAVTLTKWADGSDVSLSSATAAAGSGAWSISLASQAQGSYLLKVSITDSGNVAGAVEVIYVYPDLTTRYSKNFNSTDLGTATEIPSVDISIKPPRQGITPPTTSDVTVTGPGPFTVSAVAWKDGSSPQTSAFAGKKEYTVEITLAPNPGFKFSATSTGTINTMPAAADFSGDPNLTLSLIFDEIGEVSTVAVKTQPTKLTYQFGEKLDLTGTVLTLTLAYTDSTLNPNEPIDITFSADGFKDSNDDVWTVTSDPAHNGSALTIDDNDAKPIAFTAYTKSVNSNNLTVGPNTGNLTVEFTTPSDGTVIYNGADQKPGVGKFTVKFDTVDLTGKFTLSYKDSDGTDVTDLIDAGIYTVTATGNVPEYSGTGSVNFTITPKAITAAMITLEAGPYTYTGSQLTPVISSVLDSGDPVGAYTSSYGANIDAGTDAGSVTVTMAAGENYSGSATTPFDIAKAAFPVVGGITVSGNSATYDGSAKSATITAVGDGTVTITYDPAIPTNVGTYDIKVAVKDGTNYEDFDEDTVGTLVISRADLKASDFVAISAINYDGQPHAVTTIPNLASGKTGKGDVIAGSIRYNGGTIVPVNAGTYSITADFDVGDNYNFGTNIAVGTLTINKITPVAVTHFDIAGGDDDAVGNVVPPVVVTTKPPFDGAGTITVVYTNGDTVVTSGVPTLPGEYAVTFNVAGGVNFTARTGLDTGKTYTVPTP